MSDDLAQASEWLAAEKLKAAQNIEAAKVRSETRNRDFIVTCVVGAYAFAVGSSVLYLIAKGFIQPDRHPFKDIGELLKVAIVPILTLVIGYYFAKKD